MRTEVLGETQRESESEEERDVGDAVIPQALISSQATPHPSQVDSSKTGLSDSAACPGFHTRH